MNAINQRSSLRLELTSRALRASGIADTAWKAWSVLREETALALCDDATRNYVTADAYRLKDQYWEGSAHNRDGLFVFERTAIERFFPRPPARVLVGACGGGREVLALLSTGYEISAAYDPSDRLVTALRRELSQRRGDTPTWVGSHETLCEHSRVVRDVDAVIVGWGSYTHILGSARRVAFLRTLGALCPRGPVLLSYFAANPAGEGPARDRFRRAARALLHALPSLPRAQVEDGDCYEPTRGFSHWFTDDELRAEASAGGYDVAYLADPDQAFPHAVLLPNRAR